MSWHILIVEDSPTQAEELRIILESEGFEVDHATTGARGMARLAEARPDLVISDIVMPEMTGYDLCKRIKASRHHREIPVILLTTLSDPMDIIQGLEAGADNFLTKPCDPHHLLYRVRGLLENKRMRADGKLKVGAEIFFLGRKFQITSDKEQILDLLLSTFEDIVQKNAELLHSQRELAAAKLKIEDYARRLEGRARASEEQYRALMTQASDAIFVADDRGTVLEANPQTEHLLRVPAAELAGRAFEDLVIPEERDYVAVQLRKVLDGGRARLDNVRLSRAGAEHVCADLSASLAWIDGRRVILLIARDMTEKNRLQQQMLHNERLATVGTLAAGIVHEINNPTAVILASVDAIAERARPVAKHVERLAAIAQSATGQLGTELRRLHADAAGDLTAEGLAEAAHDCRQAGERIRDIVRDLKGFSRSDSGALEAVRVHDCLDAALRMAANEVRQHATVEKRYAADVPPIIASSRKLSQVFLNLIVNAAQAIESDRPARSVITVTTAVQAPWVQIDISDTGKGIPPEALARLFDPFFTTKRAGTGLGLWICRDIVKQHEGEIRVKSEVGRGTTFSILLPLDAGLGLPASAPRRSARPDRRLQILAIDDDPDFLKLYPRLLGKNHTVTTALGGRTALTILADQAARFDAVLCDMMMPDVDGLDVYRQVAARFPALAGRIVFLTGGLAVERAASFLASVPNPRLEKPFAVEELLRVLAEVAPAPG